MRQAVIIRILCALAALAAFAPGAEYAFAEVATPATSVPVESTTSIEFPRGMRFAAEIPVDDPATIDRVDLLYRIGPDETLNLATVPRARLVADDNGVAVDLFVDFQASFVPMGVSLTFHWELSRGGAVVLATPDEQAMWMDPRFTWNSIASEQITLYSYDLSESFARHVLDTAQATLTDLEQRYALGRLEPITVWIYASGADFSGTQQSNSREAVAGLSYPGAAVIAAVIPDGDERELGRVLPHEISHHALFQATLNPFTVPPLWFDEGIATHYQIGGTDHYAEMVERALEEGRLFEITSLNASFPFQPAQATLAYASSWSMLAYIEATWGDDGIARLIDAFGQGLAPDQAVRTALGIGIDELNDGWHTWVAATDTEQIAA